MGQNSALNSIFIICISFHLYLRCFMTHIFTDMNVCAHSHAHCLLHWGITPPLSIQRHWLKEKWNRRYFSLTRCLISHPMFWFSSLYSILFINIRLSQNAQSHSRLRRLAGDHLFPSSTQPLFREFILCGSLFNLISFLSPTPLITLLTWGQS